MKRISTLLAIVTGFFFLSACNAHEESKEVRESDQVQVITSIFPVYEITKQVAGDDADVSLMVGDNEDAHHYEPSAQAVAAVNEADVFIYSSEVMEFWVKQLLDVVENEDLKIVNLSAGLDLEMTEASDDHHEEEQSHHHHDHDHNHGGLDPHYWLDPVIVSSQLSLVTEALVEKDPSAAKSFKENEEGFKQVLSDLDKAYQEAFLTAKNRDFVVQHQAFGHLANRYDLHQIAVGGLTTEVEPSPSQLVQTIEFVKTQNVPVIYYQSGESSAIAETVANETGTDIAVLYDLENRPSSLKVKENIYVEVMTHNLEQLKLSVN